MGLTIHWDLKCNADDPLPILEQVRQLAMDLPFKSVGPMLDLAGRDCDATAYRDSLGKRELTGEEGAMLWFLISGGRGVRMPWNRRSRVIVEPIRMAGFTVAVGDGCEPVRFCLTQYPDTIKLTYNPHDDAKYQRKVVDGCRTSWEFNWRKWRRLNPGMSEFVEPERDVPTGIDGWVGGSFCKTQYASDPKCGGIANFLRCHISVVTLLDRAAKIPGLKVSLSDEGKYGRSNYTDDPSAAKPVYTWHRGKYSPAELIKEVGEWNEMIAAAAGGLQDVLGVTVDSPIKSFQDFEALEFRGRKQKAVDQFLKALARKPRDDGE
jgi:hypothetical protein